MPPSLALARLRVHWHRRAIARWAATVACAGAAGYLLAPSGPAASGRRAGHSTRRVVIVTQAIGRGAALDGKVAYASRPAGDLPAGALTVLPRGRAALVALHRGEVLTADRVSGSRGRGAAALLAPGFRGVAVALPDAAPALRLGDRVDLLTTAGDAKGSGPAGAAEASGENPSPATAARVVCAGVEVIDVRPGVVTLAVPAEQVAATAVALASAPATVVYAGAGG